MDALDEHEHEHEEDGGSARPTAEAGHEDETRDGKED